MANHADTITLNSASNNPYAIALTTLIKSLHRVTPPRAGTLDKCADHIREISAICDDWIGSVGHIASDLAASPYDCEGRLLDYRVFDKTFTGAVEGEATYIAELAAQTLYSERRVA